MTGESEDNESRANSGGSRRRSPYATGFEGSHVTTEEDIFARVNRMAGGTLGPESNDGSRFNQTASDNPFAGGRSGLASSLNSDQIQDTLYAALKYPSDENLDFDQYFGRFTRQGLANGILNKYVDDSWQQTPVIKDGIQEINQPKENENSTDFETDLRKFFTNSGPGIGLRSPPLQRMIAADIIASLGEYAVVVFGFSDGGDISDEISEGDLSSDGLEGITYIEVYPDTQADINIVEDINDERYGRPQSYEVSRQTEELGQISNTVHHTRAVHVVEGAIMDSLRGLPFFQPIINRLVDADKILGASAEGYWRGGYQGYVVRPPEDSLGRTLQFEDSSDIEEEIEDHLENFSRTIATTGNIEPLDPNVSSPADHMNQQYKAISAALDIPQSVLTGNETGERSTTEDSKMWSQTIARRRNTYVEPSILRPMIDKLVWAGIISAPESESGEYTVNWSSLDEPSKKEMAQIASGFGSAVASLTGGQASRLGTMAEFRKEIFGWDPKRGSEAPNVEEEVPPSSGPIDESDPATQAQQARLSEGAQGGNEMNTTEADRSYDGTRFDAIEDYHLYRRVDASMDELDDVYEKWRENTNMSATQLEDWADNPCASEASVDTNAVIKRNLRLLRKNKSEWTAKDIKDAKRTISFNSRMRGARSGGSEDDGPKTEDENGNEVQCPSKATISLRNWAWDPLSRYNASYSEGSTVEVDGEFGVIVAKMTSNFEDPSTDSDEEVEASSDSPVYVVAKESGGFTIVSASDLKKTSEGEEDMDSKDLADSDRENSHSWYDQVDDLDDPDEVSRAVNSYRDTVPVEDLPRANAGDPYVGFKRLPNGWNRKSVLQAWASLGGTWRTCVADMSGEIRSPRQFCSKLKDEVLMTEKWRGKF